MTTNKIRVPDGLGGFKVVGTDATKVDLIASTPYYTSMTLDGALIELGKNIGSIGSLSELETTDKTSVVAAINENVVRISEKVKKGDLFVNVKDYGAKGDGATDDYTAFANAITACPEGGTLYIPSPSPYYRISNPITLSKPISIIGPGAVFYSSPGNEMIQFDAACLYGFNIRTHDIRIDGLSILMKATGTNAVGAIFLNKQSSDPDGFIRNIHISNVDTMMLGANGAGIFGRSAITSSFTNVKCNQGKYGFFFDSLYGAGTSCKFDSCWSINNTLYGYLMAGYYYSSFINCAADTVNNGDYGYVFSSCNALAVVGSATEKFVKSAFSISDCTNVSIISALTAAISNPVFATFCEIRGTTTRVTFIGCSDLSESLSYKSIAKEVGSDHPIIMQCTFSGYFDGVTTYASTDGIRLGSALFSSAASIVPSITSLPTASADYRGHMVQVLGNSSTSDIVYVCLKSNTNTYSWKSLVTG